MPRPAFFVVFIILACCGKLRRQVPANYILLGLFVSKPLQHPLSFTSEIYVHLVIKFIPFFCGKIFLWNKKIEIICETFSWMNFEVNLHMRGNPCPFNKLENLGTFGYSVGPANLPLRGLLLSLPRQLTQLSSVRHNKLILLRRVSSSFSSQFVCKKCNFLCKIYFTSISTSPEYVVIELVSVLLMFIPFGPTLLPPGGSELTDNKHLLLLGKSRGNLTVVQ